MADIAFIIPTLSGGGAERVITTLANSIGEDVDVIVFHRVENEYPCSQNIIDLAIPGAASIPGKLKNLAIRSSKIYQLKKRHKYKKIISFLDNPNLVNVLTKKKGQQTILSIRNFQSKEFSGTKKSLHKFVVKYFYNMADAIVVTSEGVRQDMIGNFGIAHSKVKVIYNPIDQELISNLSGKRAVSEAGQKNEIKLITVGRLVEQKAHAALLRALAKYKERNAALSLSLTIIGEGAEKENLVKLAKQLGLEDNIKFLPFQKNPFQFLVQADIFILSSKFEGFPNAMVEAIACGLPVISSDCEAGPREILAPEISLDKTMAYPYSNNNGILISVPSDGNNEGFDEDFCKAMEIIAHRKNFCNEDQGVSRKLLLNRFHKREIAKMWMNL